MKKNDLLKIFDHDLKMSKNIKSIVDERISTYLSEYDGKPYGNETAGSSTIVAREIKKQSESIIPDLVEPYVDTPRIIKAYGVTKDDQAPARQQEKLLNYQFTRDFNRLEFADEAARVFVNEGTVVIKTGWEVEYGESYRYLRGINEKFLEDNGIEDYEILEQFEDGSINVNAKMEIEVINRPTAIVCKNEDIFTDPNAKTLEDSDFIIYRYETNMSQIKKNKAAYENTNNIEPNREESKDSSLGTYRESKSLENGSSISYDFEDDPRKKVTVYQYWGNLDINNDGIVVPCVVEKVDDVIIRFEENPMPDKQPPFVMAPYTKVPFSMWGESHGELITDQQKIMTSITRGVIDNMASSNNGVKFGMKGALDPINKTAYINGTSKYIETNVDPRELVDGTFNQIPQTILGFYELVKAESRQLSGVTNPEAQLGSNAAYAKTGTMSQIMSSGQKRIVNTIRKMNELIYKPMFKKWIAYNKAFLSPEQIIRINNEYIPIRKDDIQGNIDLDIVINVAGTNDALAGQITMLLQQGQALGLPFEIQKRLYSQLFEIYRQTDLADFIMEYQPQPDPKQQANEDLDMQSRVADIQKTTADARLKEAKAMEAMSSKETKDISNIKESNGSKLEEDITRQLLK